MVEIEDIRALLADDKLDEIEDLWLAELAERPEEIRFFTDTATLLANKQEKELAAFLLQLADEQLRDHELWTGYLELLEATGALYLEPTEIHATAVGALEHLYADCPSFEPLTDKVGLYRAIEDTPKIWTKIHRLRSLLRFENGSYVWMKDKGAGRVVEVNMELESFKLELNNLPPLRVGFAAAAKMLRPLEASHIERRKLEDLPALLELKKEHPGELLLVVLQSHDDPLTAAEIRQALSGVVDEKEWTSWWSIARKHPRILAGTTKGRQTYGWAASEDHALDEVRDEFTAADIETKLEILRKNADRDASLREEMIEELTTLAEKALASDEADTSLRVWYALDRLGCTGGLEWSPATIVLEHAAPATLAGSLADRALRERFYQVCAEERADWPQIYRQAIGSEDDPRALTMLASRLGSEEPEELNSIVDDILGHPRRRPAAFVWLAESGDTLAALTERNPLRLIRQILDALHQTEFTRFRTRLHKAFETGGGAVHLFAKLTEEQAAQAKRAVERAPLEEHLRESLVRYLHVRFPALDGKRETPLYATIDSIEARRQELEKLKLEEIPANRRAIAEARELGDLRENFEYKSARQRHEYLNARLASLQSDLSRVQPLTADRVDASEARVGCRVALRSATGESRTVTILGPWESDPERHIVSYDSELGQALLGKKAGESVTLEEAAWTLETLEPWQS